jgi:pimeloyl-ACP methyl ester carboxylesterase
MKINVAAVWLVTTGALVSLAASDANGQAPVARKHFVIVHGAWGGGWDWRVIDSILTRQGHSVDRVTLTGLGDRVHLASPNIGLDTHITDVVHAIEFERLTDVVLIGHSYGGMVITGVAERIPQRIRHLVYIDAFVPESGESVKTLAEKGFDAMVTNMAKDGMLVPPWVGTDVQVPKDVPHPLRTFTDTLVLRNPAARAIPGTYILTIEKGATTDAFSRYAERAAARKWRVHRMESTDHVPERSAPDALATLLVAVP